MWPGGSGFGKNSVYFDSQYSSLSFIPDSTKDRPLPPSIVGRVHGSWIECLCRNRNIHGGQKTNAPRYPYDSWTNRIATHRFVIDIPMSPSHPSWGTLKRIENQLKTLAHLPIQFNWGMQDWCFSPHFLDRWKEIFPSASVCEHQQAGHYLMEDSREEVIAGIQSFLEGARASS